MKRFTIASFLGVFTLGISCLFAAIPPTAIVEQTFTNKFGATTSKDEWETRGKTGQIISIRASGVKVTENYYKGVVEGKTTYTFPKSDLVEKTEIYADGKITSVISHYPTGTPRQEIFPLSTALIQATTWYENGIPKSIEELDGELVINGIYYHPHHEEESRVVQGFGVRTQRDSKGVFISKETIQDGIVVLQTTYHPGGEVKSLATLDNGTIHGTHKIFDNSGQPVEIQEWANGRLHGMTIQYHNGEIVAQIPYWKGLKDGVERHFSGPTLLWEVSWHNGLKNGASKKYSPTGTEVQWFLAGQPISKPKQIVSEMPPVPKAPKQLPTPVKSNKLPFKLGYE